MRTQAEWNVDTHMRRATGPTSASTRSRISWAALLVKVMARISKGETPCSAISQAMRWVSTRVLPEPAPATMRSGPPAWVTACGLGRVEAGEEVVARARSGRAPSPAGAGNGPVAGFRPRTWRRCGSAGGGAPRIGTDDWGA